MNERRETAYGPVFGFLAVLIVALLLAVRLHQHNPRVTMILTHPSPYQKK